MKGVSIELLQTIYITLIVFTTLFYEGPLL
ncbi:hypothetical protein CLV42_107303 [Chitinophaga ginsengisoli]|uniref:Uncharacterized protein n=1 Tax=Chitinophaga ginsengisoli TaxID=363837 RepID=A0A2P8G5C7_9BACT|nr:hypothetical protein CLV42_107303 [Chitinophaga ginsengisoli]